MELTPEIKEALEKQKVQCPFCKIIKGEIPATKVYEDDKVLAILDINPLADGHVLLLPKEHYPILPYLPEDEFEHLMEVTQDMVGVLKKSLVKTGCNVMIANGAVAGQNSPHFMLHIIPREPEDGISAFNLTGNKSHEGVEVLKNNVSARINAYYSAHPLDWLSVKQQSFTFDKVIELIKQNPPIKDLIERDPTGFKQQVSINPQLKALFVDVEIDDVINYFSNGDVKSGKANNAVDVHDEAKDNADADVAGKSGVDDDAIDDVAGKSGADDDVAGNDVHDDGVDDGTNSIDKNSVVENSLDSMLGNAPSSKSSSDSSNNPKDETKSEGNLEKKSKSTQEKSDLFKEKKANLDKISKLFK